MRVFTTSLLAAGLALCALVSRAVTFYRGALSDKSAFQTLVDQAQAGENIILCTGSHYVATSIRLSVGKSDIAIQGEAGAVVRNVSNLYNAAAFKITGNYNSIDQLELDSGNLSETIIYGQHSTVPNSRLCLAQLG